MAKGKKKEKRVTVTAAKLKQIGEQLYWQILRMFLAAAMDVYGWKEQEVVDFAARVNWYFDAARKEHTITEGLVDELLEANMGIIMKKTQAMKERTDPDEDEHGTID